VTAEEADLLRRSHTFLRSLELMARMESDTNVSWISSESSAVDALAVRMGFARPDAGEKLLEKYRETAASIRGLYTRVKERIYS